ncbi:hypothetical protein PPROV_000127400 [Pycnococcus provasolii]|uniref:Uncharacterized protein n=1 Tax=Pycnococcus provasolii TaxID=41880 RepID=A0A830HBP9_9CHLO|nr:hypothetical protein PPROV_000127400 [Pycnococcus provasolii]
MLAVSSSRPRRLLAMSSRRCRRTTQVRATHVPGLKMKDNGVDDDDIAALLVKYASREPYCILTSRSHPSTIVPLTSEDLRRPAQLASDIARLLQCHKQRKWCSAYLVSEVVSASLTAYSPALNNSAINDDHSHFTTAVMISGRARGVSCSPCKACSKACSKARSELADYKEASYMVVAQELRLGTEHKTACSAVPARKDQRTTLACVFNRGKSFSGTTVFNRVRLTTQLKADLSLDECDGYLC